MHMSWLSYSESDKLDKLLLLGSRPPILSWAVPESESESSSMMLFLACLGGVKCMQNAGICVGYSTLSPSFFNLIDSRT